MGTPTKLYALTHGCYSDYRVDALFTTEAKAKEAASITGGETSAFLVYDEVPAKQTSYLIQIEVRDDGTHGEPDLRVETDWPWDMWKPPVTPPRVRFVRAPVHKDKGGRLEVHGASERAVRKVASDHLAQLLVHAAQTGKAGPEVNV